MPSLYLADLDAHLSYHDLAGRAPVCVYVHGLGLASSADFPSIARDPQLAPYRAVLVDLLGYGFSDRPAGFSHTLEAHADVIAHLLDQLGLQDCHVIGHSMGGSIAIALAARRPDLVGALIVAEPNLDPEDASFSGVIVARWPTEEAFVTAGHATLITEAEAEARPLSTSLTTGSYAGTLRAADARALYRCSGALVGCELRETFFNLTMPRTYVYGAHTLPHRHESWLQAEGVPVAVVPEAGHDMLVTNPGAFAAVIARVMGDG